MMSSASPIEIATPHGPARAHLHPAQGADAGGSAARAALVLGHGAGGGVDAPDIVAATEVAVSHGVTVALVEQPYRVAGRRAPAPARQLDAAWLAAVEHLVRGPLEGSALIVGGRSLGARVACRSAGEVGAVAVLCLAFPLQPPARRGKEPGPSRLAELDAVSVPVLAVQGESDQFGMPPSGPARRVVVVPGNHSLRSDLDAVGEAVRDWLPGILEGLGS
jgi:uncharacterized protein